MIGIVSEVTPLAHGKQILIAAILRCMVEMRGGENHLRAGNGVRLAVDRGAPSFMSAALATTFADATGTIKADASRNLIPIIWISLLVFSRYRQRDLPGPHSIRAELPCHEIRSHSATGTRGSD